MIQTTVIRLPNTALIRSAFSSSYNTVRSQVYYSTASTAVQSSQQSNSAKADDATTTASSYKAPTPPTGVQLNDIITDIFPLPVKESFKHFLQRKKIEQIQDDLLSITPFYPEPSATHKAEIIKTQVDSSGNYMNEFYIAPKNSTEKDYAKAKHLIFIHGYGAGLGFFVKNLEKIAEMNKDWHIHAIDLLGYGCSSRPSFPHRIPYDNNARVEKIFTDTLSEWFTQRGLDKTKNLVAAHSMGAYLTAVLNFTRPDLFQKIMMISPGGIYESRKMTVPAWFAQLWNWNWSPFSVVRNSGPFGSMLVSGWTSRRWSKSLDILNLQNQKKMHMYTYAIFSAKGSGEFMLNYLLAPGGVPRKPLVERIQNLNCDSTWIYGDRDWMDKTGGKLSCDILKKKGLGADFRVVPNAGHHVYLDGFDTFNDLITNEMNEFKEKY
ncbi:unnamed protein product [Ambrosiozyma monospora]|uniref:Unnamed protein product n=1 Tax=Ambrosiozyma monospora TaxID=43982 RepID=A0A9W6YSA9_AMBMO|nr:unnamed protein product [Ambrosiozyma monospora]